MITSHVIDFPEFKILLSSYNNEINSDYLSKLDIYNHDFDTFLEKYNIYTNINEIYKSDFEDLYKYLYRRFGDHSVCLISSLVFDVMIPIQDLLKELEDLNENEILKYNFKILKLFEELINEKSENKEYEDIDNILDSSINEIKYNSQILLNIALIKLFESVLKMTKSEDLIKSFEPRSALPSKNITEIVKELYSNIPDEINYKCIYKYLLHLPFSLNGNIHDTIFSMSNLYYSDKESDEYLSNKLYKLDEYVEEIEDDEDKSEDEDE